MGVSFFTGVGAPGTVNAASGGKVSAFNTISTVPSVVAAINAARVQITFHNPGTQDIFVAPSVTGTGAALVPSLAALGGCFRVFANGGTLVISGECQTAWQAFAAANANNPLTVMDSNV